MTDITLSLTLAEGFTRRARGLLFSRPLPAGQGLLLPRTSAVHGLLMNRTLDLVFLQADGRVLATAVLRPGRLRWHRGAAAVVELEAGQVAALGIRPGDRIVTDTARVRPSRHRRGRATRAAVVSIPVGILLGIAGPGGQDGGAGLGMGLSAAQASSGDGRPAQGLRAAILPAAWVTRFADQAEKLYQSGADEAALAAFGAWLDADPAAEAVVILRIGNIHQRNGRDWLAIDSYRRALDLAPGDDPVAVEARRKALMNLEGLLDAASQRLAAILGQATTPGGTTRTAGSQRASRPVSPATAVSPLRAVSPATAVSPSGVRSPSTSPSNSPSSSNSLASGRSSASAGPNRSVSSPAAPAGAMPTIEYLGLR